MKACSHSPFSVDALLSVALLLALPIIGTAQQSPKVPDSVAAMAKKYDETRQKTLGPLLESFAQDLKLTMVPALTRQGKADVAIKIGEAADALKNAPVPVLPSSGAPFPAELFTMVQASPEWGVFSIKFTQAESALNESYKKALEREKIVFQNKGDPYAMVAVDNEAKRVDALKTGTGAAVPAAASTATAATTPAPAAKEPTEPKKTSAADKRRIESWLVGKTWAVGGTEELLFFSKGGKGLRKIATGAGTLQWVIEDDGRVRVSAGFGKHITLTSPTEGTIVVHGKTDQQHDLKISNEVIEAPK